MLFNSYEFIFVFLPVTLVAYYLLGWYSDLFAKLTLAIASLVFYSFWNVDYLPILLCSLLFNWCASQTILAENLSPRQRNLALTGALAVNLVVLSYFKYSAFLLSLLHGEFNAHAQVANLPLGISFFTFTQIAFLVDARRGAVQSLTFLNFFLFVTVFPHLIAGPILHHRSMFPQFADRKTYLFNSEFASRGLMFFAIGLAKKVLIADAIAPYADQAFSIPAPNLIEAWCGALAYTFQIYFDFSGYSDMAVGLGLLIGLKLPINFSSPYQATSIIDFWRCWHITLSNFLRDYLYIPLGGNRNGDVRRWTNLFITMLLGGLWHGANMTFVLWGALHGFYLVINHAWRNVQSRMGLPALGSVGQLFAWLVTFLAVVASWVFFRAEDLNGAWRMVRGLVGLNGIDLPQTYAHYPILRWLVAMGWPTGDLRSFSGFEELAWLGAVGALALLFPNSQSIVSGVDARRRGWMPKRLYFQPSPIWAFICIILLVAGILGMSQESRFLYFQF